MEEVHLHGISSNSNKILHVDAKGSQCPGPIMALHDELRQAAVGQHIIIEVTDPGFKSDLVAWCHVTENELVSLNEENGVFTAEVIKQKEFGESSIPKKEDSVTLVVFSNEMDKGMAAFNIALGALAMGMQVQVFFTFWGLSLIRKSNDEKVHKSIMETMEAKMMPKDDKSLPLSHMNLMGMGRKMMEKIMKDKQVPPLDFMIHLAKFDGVKFIACQMSMEILDIKKEDLLENIEIGGVATMVEFARKSNVQFFI